MVRYVGEDHLLIAPTKEAHNRFHRRFVNLPRYDHSLDHKCPYSSEYARHEFRAPSSDARHDLSILMVMAAVYRLLEGKGWQSSAGFPSFPETHEGSIELFEKHSRLMPDLMEMMQDSPDMQEHVTALKAEIIAAARENRLHQPSLAELRARAIAGPHSAAVTADQPAERSVP